jgi:putative transposase
MRDSITYLHTHLICTTRDRQPLIDGIHREAIFACIEAECRRLKAIVTAIGGTEDHVHLLVDIPPTITIADVVKRARTASARLMNDAPHCQSCPEATSLPRCSGSFRWQAAYGAFSVSADDVQMIASYISRQPELHRRGATYANLEWMEATSLPRRTPARRSTAVVPAYAV